jgi:single-strand DNA-binding protein
MSTTITVQVVGHLTHDVELRHTATGTPVASIRLAVTPRRPAGNGTFENGETSYLSGSVFGPTAEHVAASLKSGHRVLVIGRLVERSFTATRGDREGETIRRHELVVDEIGPTLRFATAVVTKAARSSAADEAEDASA